MRQIYKLLLIVVGFIFTTSCDDYLSKESGNNQNEVLNNAEQVKALFNNSEMFITLANVTAASSDDYGLTTQMYDNLGYLSASSLCGISWSLDGVNSSKSDETWTNEFNKIFVANLILNEIENVTDISEEDRIEYLAHAHFVRAVANWELANIYCQPYSEETLQGLGLPLKKTTSYEESLVRSSLMDTYAFIESDLKEALNTSRIDVEERWLVSQPAVEAMLARFYLFTKDYANAEKYATEALKSQKAELEDYNNIGYIERDMTSNTTGESYKVLYSDLYGYGPIEYTDYKELYYSHRYKVESAPNLVPSEELTSLYDKENDLRYSLLFVEHGLLEYGLEDMSENDLLYHKFYYSREGDILPAAPTVPEMILTKAEALARQGNFSEAMTELNILRKARIKIGEAYELTATDQETAIKEIIKERHREMPFTMRWYDIRRLAYNETTADDVEVQRSFYGVNNGYVNYELQNYILPVKSKRYAQPILELEIARSNGQMVQNEY